MGKGKRLKAERKKKKDKFFEKMAKDMFNDPDLESLTDELIAELHNKQGIPLNDLKELQANGAKYARSGNTFKYPIEFETF